MEFIKPKIQAQELTPTHGIFTVEPLERGYGMTLGNALRRVLLSSIPGAAITRVRFDGYHHEYETLPGVKEDVLEILLNLKELALRLSAEELRHLYLSVEGPCEVTAAQIEAEPGVEIINPEHHIATLGEKGRLALEMEVEPGYGYRPAERNKKKDSPLGVIPLDAIFSPVRRVNFRVEETRVGERTDYDRLLLEVETNGGVRPEEAVHHASSVLIEHFRLFQEFAAHPFGLEAEPAEEEPPELEMSLLELGFDRRACNLLESKGVVTLADLVKKSREEIKDIHGFGDKTLDKVLTRLSELGYELAVKTKAKAKDKDKDKAKKAVKA